MRWQLMLAVLLVTGCSGGTTPAGQPAAAGATGGRAGAPAGATAGERCAAFVANGLAVAQRTRAELREEFGAPDTVIARTEPNRHVPGATDSLFAVRYPGLTVEIRKPASGGDMAERVTVTYPRNLTYAEPGIGARETRVVELLGEPTTRETGRLTYECGTGPAPPRVSFVIENAAVSEVVFAFYVD
jgi:hypothetical protein